MNRDVVLIAGMAVVTFAIRYVLIAAGDRIRLPKILADAFQYVPPAVLTGLIFPAILLPSDSSHIVLISPYVVSAIAAVAAGILSRRLIVTIVTGLGVYLVLHFVIGW